MKIYKSLFWIALLFPAMLSAQKLALYPGAIPNSKPSPDNEKTEFTDGITIVKEISRPTLTVFPPQGTSNGTALIICPGGGYWINAASHEGSDVAKKFNAMGVTVFVLKYRIPNDATMINREIGPLQDAQQAIKMVRERAKEWKINPDRIGIMGFSAGGHLASTAGTHFETSVIDNPKKVSLRPDFMMLIYPVISFQDSTGHMGSREQLIGKNPSADKIRLYSNEYQVNKNTPPTFLVHASDDDVVMPENSIVFYQQLIRNHIPAEMHIYQAGGHGYGMNNKTTTDSWVDRAQAWLASNGWLKK
jgi:acetyl esterase/lipase